jgi:hypothetical protein
MMLPILAKRTHINRSSSSASTMYALRGSPVLRHSGGTLIGHRCHKPTPKGAASRVLVSVGPRVAGARDWAGSLQYRHRRNVPGQLCGRRLQIRVTGDHPDLHRSRAAGLGLAQQYIGPSLQGPSLTGICRVAVSLADPPAGAGLSQNRNPDRGCHSRVRLLRTSCRRCRQRLAATQVACPFSSVGHKQGGIAATDG